MSKKNESGDVQPIGKKPRRSTVFHVLQTEAMSGYSDRLWQYALQNGVLDDVKAEEGEIATGPELMGNTADGRTIHAMPDGTLADFGYYSDEFTPVQS